MAPYEALYGRKCRTPLCWMGLSERRVLGPELLQKTEDNVVERVRPFAYRLELPPKLQCILDVFHVSMLRRYKFDPSHVIPTEVIEVRLNLSYEEEPIQILAHDEKVL
ncbi:hypothetical protein GQ457_18G014810 [Hibiscus cannabinus]